VKTVKLKYAIETLEKLKDGYEELRNLIADQVRDNEIDEAKENFEKLQGLKNSIEQMENLDVLLD
jgi:lysozyme family protein